ncbi:MAG: class I SAM-dependent methyltransferase [Theionarchaea archaeon]|nr:class I SAM-dependent methyltransferase [Theionarchaea archaeon]
MTTSPQEISRVTRSKEEARRSYDRMSTWYDFLAGSERRHTHEGLQKLNVRDGETVLEVGFGTGESIVSLAHSVGSSGAVYGIDISSGMFYAAIERVRRAGLQDSVGLILGDGAHLPFKTHIFDAVFMSFTLELFDTPEIQVVLTECRRVLVEGGRIGVVAMSKRGRQGIMVDLYEWAHRTFPQYVDCRPIYVRNALEEGQFHIVDDTAMSMWGLPVEIVVAQT